MSDVHRIPRVGRGAIPGGVGGGEYNEPAFAIPPAAAVHHRTVVCVCVVVHVQCRKFQSVMRHHQKRMSEAQQIVDATDTAVRITSPVTMLAFALNNNRTLKG